MNSPDPSEKIEFDANAQVEQLSQLAGAACESATKFVRENPIACTVAAVGVGIGVGLLVGKVAKNSSALESVLSNEELGNQLLGMVAKTLPQIIENQFRS